MLNCWFKKGFPTNCPTSPTFLTVLQTLFDVLCNIWAFSQVRICRNFSSASSNLTDRNKSTASRLDKFVVLHARHVELSSNLGSVSSNFRQKNCNRTSHVKRPINRCEFCRHSLLLVLLYGRLSLRLRSYFLQKLV